MSNLNLQKLREWVWPWPWTFKTCNGRWFDCWSGRRYQVAITWMQTGKPSRYITNCEVNSVYHPSRAGVMVEQVHLSGGTV